MMILKRCLCIAMILIIDNWSDPRNNDNDTETMIMNDDNADYIITDN